MSDADGEAEEGSDHLHVIYGWTRDAIIYCVRVRVNSPCSWAVESMFG